MSVDCFMGRIFELSNERQITGRRKIKIVLHEIFPSHDTWQENGISWDEEYTAQNIESVTNMSICVEFLSEERRLPYGHGLTDIKDNMPYMEDATVVGHCEKGYITDIEIDGETKKVLVGEGYIDEMRYPKFVAWLAEKLKNGSVKGSVEIVGRPEMIIVLFTMAVGKSMAEFLRFMIIVDMPFLVSDRQMIPQSLLS